jgi:hypothetical protein
MCCNFAVEAKVGVDDRNLARRSEQIENKTMEQTDARCRRTSRGLAFADHMDGSVATLGMKAAGCDNRMN